MYVWYVYSHLKISKNLALNTIVRFYCNIATSNAIPILDTQTAVSVNFDDEHRGLCYMRALFTFYLEVAPAATRPVASGDARSRRARS